jgi:aminomethyltransferase
MNSTLGLRTPFYNWHASHGGRIVEFGGWEMPVQYSSIVAEHQAVRQAAGLFDISHMGRIRFTGPQAVGLLDHLVTNNVGSLSPGQIQYALVVNEQGGILDDVLVYRFHDFHLLVVNASNRRKILDWIDHHKSAFNATVEDQTLSQCMLALQGPYAAKLLQPFVEHDLSSILYYHGVTTRVSGVAAIVSRTGYTGEDGFEVILPAAEGPRLWEALLEQGAAQGVLPCGLGCRDTLRLEAAMPLYGHELNDQTDPYTAGLGFAVKLDKREFIGKAALAGCKSSTSRKRRVGLELEGKRIAREGAPVLAAGSPIGHVTSGTFSPTLQKSIAMAYVPADHAAIGTPLEVDIRGQRVAAKVVKLPFYKRTTNREH